MHELPKDLSNSLRSFRGSIYGNQSIKQVESDLEKGPPDDKGEHAGYYEASSPEQSSLILHPEVSKHSLRQAQRQQQQQHPHYDYTPINQQDHDPSSQQQRHPPLTNPNQTKPSALAKRQTTLPPETPASQKLSIFHGAKVRDPDPAADRLDDDTTPLSLAHFYELMGMNPPNRDNSMPKKLAIPGGLYATITSTFKAVQYKYRIFDVATYILLALQLILSAIFIILGSIRTTPHVAIAILGAVSAVVAGVLSLMKGQGLPNRLRQVRDDLKNVLFTCEELYWDVAAERPVLFRDVKKVREDYLRVLMEARKNHPDTWNSASEKVMKGVEKTTTKGGGMK